MRFLHLKIEEKENQVMSCVHSLIQRFNVIQATIIKRIINNDDYVKNCLREQCEKKYKLPAHSLTFREVSMQRGRLVFSDLRFPFIKMHYFTNLREVISLVGIIESIKRLNEENYDWSM